MYFDLEGRNFETPTIESAISWREQALLSFFGHVLLALLVIFAPRLSFFEEMAERREAQLEELARVQEMERLARLEALPQSEETFVFVQPRVELPLDQPPPEDAMPSDRDRLAMSPERRLRPGQSIPESPKATAPSSSSPTNRGKARMPRETPTSIPPNRMSRWTTRIHRRPRPPSRSRRRTAMGRMGSSPRRCPMIRADGPTRRRRPTCPRSPTRR